MKNLFKKLVLFCLLIIVGVASVSIGYANTTYEEYHNTTYRYSLEVPSNVHGRILDYNDASIIVPYYDDLFLKIGITDIKNHMSKEDKDKIDSNKVEDLDINHSIFSSTYGNFEYIKSEADKFVTETDPNAKIDGEPSKILLGGIDAYKFKYNIYENVKKAKNKTGQGLCVCTIYKGRMYNFVFVDNMLKKSDIENYEFISTAVSSIKLSQKTALTEFSITREMMIIGGGILGFFILIIIIVLILKNRKKKKTKISNLGTARDIEQEDVSFMEFDEIAEVISDDNLIVDEIYEDNLVIDPLIEKIISEETIDRTNFSDESKDNKKEDDTFIELHNDEWSENEQFIINDDYEEENNKKIKEEIIADNIVDNGTIKEDLSEFEDEDIVLDDKIISEVPIKSNIDEKINVNQNENQEDDIDLIDNKNFTPDEVIKEELTFEEILTPDFDKKSKQNKDGNKINTEEVFLEELKTTLSDELGEGNGQEDIYIKNIIEDISKSVDKDLFENRDDAEIEEVKNDEKNSDESNQSFFEDIFADFGLSLGKREEKQRTKEDQPVNNNQNKPQVLSEKEIIQDIVYGDNGEVTGIIEDIAVIDQDEGIENKDIKDYEES